MRNHFHILFIIKLFALSSVLLNKAFPTLQLWFVFFPNPSILLFFFTYEKLRKVFLEYCQISRSYLQKGLQEKLGKASSLLKNVRNFKHVSKKQGPAPPGWSGVLKGRNLQADASKSKSVSSEVMADRKKICHFEPNWTIFFLSFNDSCQFLGT